jgi:hypothetical protein
MPTETVTTWVGVAATTVSAVATIAAIYIRNQTKAKLAAIEKGTPEAARIIADAVTSVNLDTSNLTKRQIFDLAKAEIERRDNRNKRMLMAAVVVFGILTATTVVLARGSSVDIHGDGNTVLQGSPSATANTTREAPRR